MVASEFQPSKKKLKFVAKSAPPNFLSCHCLLHHLERVHRSSSAIDILALMSFFFFFFLGCRVQDSALASRAEGRFFFVMVQSSDRRLLLMPREERKKQREDGKRAGFCRRMMLNSVYTTFLNR